MPGLEHITRCIELTEADIRHAIASSASFRELFDHLVKIARPNEGAPKILLLFARLAASGCDWLDDKLVLELIAADQISTFEVMTELSGGMRERFLPRTGLRVPLSEFTRALDRAPHVVAPLRVQTKTPARIVLAAVVKAPVVSPTDAAALRAPVVTSFALEERARKNAAPIALGDLPKRAPQISSFPRSVPPPKRAEAPKASPQAPPPPKVPVLAKPDRLPPPPPPRKDLGAPKPQVAAAPKRRDSVAKMPAIPPPAPKRRESVAKMHAVAQPAPKRRESVAKMPAVAQPAPKRRESVAKMPAVAASAARVRDTIVTPRTDPAPPPVPRGREGTAKTRTSAAPPPTAKTRTSAAPPGKRRASTSKMPGPTAAAARVQPQTRAGTMLGLGSFEHLAPGPLATEETLIAQLGSLASVPRVAMATRQRLAVDPAASLVLAQIDGVSTLEEILEGSGMSRLDTLRSVWELVEQHIVEVD